MEKRYQGMAPFENVRHRANGEATFSRKSKKLKKAGQWK